MLCQGSLSLSSGRVGKLAVLYGELNAMRVGEAAAGVQCRPGSGQRAGGWGWKTVQPVRSGDARQSVRSQRIAERSHSASTHPDLETSETRVIEYQEVLFLFFVLYL